MPAADRRDLVIDAAIAEFGRHGWHGARIEAIAAHAEISHPYMLRLFATKRELFLAATDRAFDRMETALTAAVEAADGERAILAMGEAYRQLLTDDPATLRLHMHALAAAGDERVGAAVTARYERFLAHMRSLANASDDRVRTCFAVGLTLTVVTALDLPDRQGDLQWAARLLASGAPELTPHPSTGATMTSATPDDVLTLERRGHVLLMGLNRPSKRNAFTSDLLLALGNAYGELERDDDLRCGVLFAHGDHFTGGLDLAEVGPKLADGTLAYPAEARDPWRNDGKAWTTPVIAAAHGWCMTLGIELLLAADIRIASRATRFAQLDVQRGIYPFGGATIRLPRDAGWGNAMRWLLTGDEFDADEAHRIGLVQEVTDPGQQLQRAIELAERIADHSAPLGVRTTLLSAQRAVTENHAAAAARLTDDMVALLRTQDGVEGMMSFVERRSARFTGH